MGLADDEPRGFGVARTVRGIHPKWKETMARCVTASPRPQVSALGERAAG